MEGYTTNDGLIDGPYVNALQRQLIFDTIKGGVALLNGVAAPC
jgi:hypothetical protein